jgi:hypothetical protein
VQFFQSAFQYNEIKEIKAKPMSHNSTFSYRRAVGFPSGLKKGNVMTEDLIASAFAPNLTRALFENRKFIDLAATSSEDEKVDVIIPVLHSNDLWHENLTSYFREIPINRILLGDAGCIDQTVQIAQNFPRIEIINHRHLKTLGSSIADLITKVKTENFVYLQSDVYIPDNWFSKVKPELRDHDWISTPQQIVVMLDYLLDYEGRRPMSGAQLGKKKIFHGIDGFIEDDFVYRNEEYVLANYVNSRGGSATQVSDAFHFHQIMRRKTLGMEMLVTSVTIQVEEKSRELQRVHETQIFGLIKYCQSTDNAAKDAAESALFSLLESSFSNIRRCVAFARLHNEDWQKFLLKRTAKFLLLWSIRAPRRALRHVSANGRKAKNIRASLKRR